MPHYLLTGAGFSANWGGWVASEAFEYLLGCPEIMSDQSLRDLLWKYQASGGFEDALAELQRGHSQGFAEQWSERQLIAFQGCVGRMFDDLNQGFLNRRDLEFSRTDASRMVRSFLMRFDVIFTLNQDILLEHFFVPRYLGWREFNIQNRFTPSLSPARRGDLSRPQTFARQRARNHTLSYMGHRIGLETTEVG
jgi:hypothetical protein